MILRLIIFTGFTWFACMTMSALPSPTKDDLVHAPREATIESLVHGRKLYIAKCGGCHRLYAPRERAQAEWTEIVHRMQKIFPLSENESRLISQYLVTFGRR